MKAVVLALVAAVIVSAPALAGTRTGLRGIVMRGPTTPVCQAGTSCSAPAKHTTLTFTRNGVTKSAVTGDDGRYAIQLAAGSWVVNIRVAKLGFRPHAVYVRAGRMSIKNFSIDTGIR